MILSERYEGFVCDLDGVVYRGKEPVVGAKEALNAILEDQRPVRFATNNASRLPRVVADQLRDMGLAVSDDLVLTSSQAGARHLAETLASGSAVLAVGGEGVHAALTEVGLRPVAPQDGGEDVSAVLQGYGAQVTANDLAHTVRYVAAGTIWIATNRDLTLPNEWGFGPGNGAFVSLVEQVSGRSPDLTVGKPFPPLYGQCAQSMGLTSAQILAIGDRLDTDIDGAGQAGMDSLLVLTGVDGLASLVAHQGHQPNYLCCTLDGLGREYAEPQPRDGARTSAQCGDAVVAWTGSDLIADGGTVDEQLRAAHHVLIAERQRGTDLTMLVHAARRWDSTGQTDSR